VPPLIDQGTARERYTESHRDPGAAQGKLHFRIITDVA
jgi:hypothetical protein